MVTAPASGVESSAGSGCRCAGLCDKLCRLFSKKNDENFQPYKMPALLAAPPPSLTHHLEDVLSIGSLVTITATPTDDVPWFDINLGVGDPGSDSAEIALHFNPRMPQRYVVRNTRRHGSWGPEETTSFRPFPFKLGQQFTVEIVVDEWESLVAVDGEHYCRYAHRSPPPAAALWVSVHGARDAAVAVSRASTYPQLAATQHLEEVPQRSGALAPPAAAEPAWRANMAARLPAGVPEGHQLVLCGRLRPLLHSFHVELADGAQEWPHANVLLHANLRAHVQPTRPHQLVVLNTWLGAWGEERRQLTARLVPGTEVTLRVVRGAGEWAVWAGDVLLGSLDHRGHPDGAKVVRLRGDLVPSALYIAPVH